MQNNFCIDLGIEAIAGLNPGKRNVGITQGDDDA